MREPLRHVNESESLCPNLKRNQKLWGFFIICGFGELLLVFIYLMLFFGKLKLGIFIFLYITGNICTLSGSCFLIKPKNQLNRMNNGKKLIIIILLIVFIILALLIAMLCKKGNILIIIFALFQLVCMALYLYTIYAAFSKSWYNLSGKEKVTIFIDDPTGKIVSTSEVDEDVTLEEIIKKVSRDNKKYAVDTAFSTEFKKMSCRKIGEVKELLDDFRIHLISLEEKLIKTLEESEINFKTNGSNCFQSCLLQLLIHCILPCAIKKLTHIKNLNDLETISKYGGPYFSRFIEEVIKIIKFQNNWSDYAEARYDANGFFYDLYYNLRIRAVFKKVKNFIIMIILIFLEIKRAVEESPNIENEIIRTANSLGNLRHNEGNNSFNFEAGEGDDYPKLLEDYIKNFDLFKPIVIKKETLLSRVLNFDVSKRYGNKIRYGNFILNLRDKYRSETYLSTLLNECEQLENNAKICMTSDVLLFIVNRLDIENKREIKTIVHLPNDLDLSNYCSNDLKNTKDAKFQLHAVIMFRSFNDDSDNWETTGQFEIYIKIKEKWRLYSDLDNSDALYEDPPLNDRSKRVAAFCYRKKDL